MPTSRAAAPRQGVISGGALWPLTAGGGALFALLAAPLARAEAPPLLALLAIGATVPLLLAGLALRSPGLLLGAVPVGWALAAGGASAHLSGLLLTGAAALSAGAYLMTAAHWLSRPLAAAHATWRTLEGRPPAASRRSPSWLVAALVAGPPLGVALWPEIPARLARGFPEMAGTAQVGLALAGTLVGLALARDLFRPVQVRAGSPWVALGWAALAACLFAVWAVSDAWGGAR